MAGPTKRMFESNMSETIADPSRHILQIACCITSSCLQISISNGRQNAFSMYISINIVGITYNTCRYTYSLLTSNYLLITI